MQNYIRTLIQYQMWEVWLGRVGGTTVCSVESYRLLVKRHVRSHNWRLVCFHSIKYFRFYIEGHFFLIEQYKFRKGK
jgi:hypothetical protein